MDPTAARRLHQDSLVIDSHNDSIVAEATERDLKVAVTQNARSM